MMKKEFSDIDIVKKLLRIKKPPFFASLFCTLVFFSLFLSFGITSIVFLVSGISQWWIMTIPALLMLLATLLTFKLLAIKKQYLRIKSIKNQRFSVVTDYCDKIDVFTYDSDGPSTAYIWHFFQSNIQIKETNPSSDFIQKRKEKGDYYLIFLDNKNKPVLFYSCEHYKYLS